jgi:hypothetical protein
MLLNLNAAPCYIRPVQVTRAASRSNYLQEVLYRTLFEAEIMELLLVVAQHAGVSVYLCPNVGKPGSLYALQCLINHPTGRAGFL